MWLVQQMKVNIVSFLIQLKWPWALVSTLKIEIVCCRIDSLIRETEEYKYRTTQ